MKSVQKSFHSILRPFQSHFNVCLLCVILPKTNLFETFFIFSLFLLFSSVFVASIRVFVFGTIEFNDKYARNLKSMHDKKFVNKSP